MTPNDLEILIHCYCSREEHPRYNAPAVQETYLNFEKDGVIKSTEGIYSTTELGEAWLSMILGTPKPKPKHVWIDPRTSKEVRSIR